MSPIQKHLVISAVNFTEGGPLRVLQEALESAARILPPDWKITALVHDKDLVANDRVVALEFPGSKRSWFVRLWLEWYKFGPLSRKLKPDLWLSLHDITSRVNARRQAVYCHNPAPFHRLTWKDARLEPKFALFNLFYGLLYGMFISRNQALIVQQEWLRQVFSAVYSHPNIVVAHPTQKQAFLADGSQDNRNISFQEKNKVVFLYPALPRVFKNLEVICEAMALLPAEVQRRVELRLTSNGAENAYARYLYRRFSSVPGIRFVGHQSRQQIEQQYLECDVVVFPSRLETWGLPISEAKSWGKPIMAADLPYAHETVGHYAAVKFLPAENAAAWALQMHRVVSGENPFEAHGFPSPNAPFASDWGQLWPLLIEGL